MYIKIFKNTNIFFKTLKFCFDLEHVIHLSDDSQKRKFAITKFNFLSVY